MFDRLINSQKEAIRSVLLNSHLKELLAGSTIAFVFSVLGAGGGYIFAYIVSNTYGTRGMGVYSLTYSVLVILEILGTLGFRNSILRFVGHYYSENNHKAIRGIYHQMLRISSPIALLFSVLLALFSYQIATLIFHDIILRSAFLILSLMTPFYVINALNVELIRSLRNIPLSEYLRDLNKPIFCILTLLVLNRLWSNVYAPLISLGISFIVAFFISSIYLRKKLNSLSRESERLLSNRELAKISFSMMITAFSFLIMGQLDLLMLGMFSTTENAGVYSVAVRLATVTSYVLFALNIIAAPKFAELYWSKNFSALKDIVRFATKITFWCSLPFLLAYGLFPGFFMGIFGTEFTKGRTALIFLAIGQFINSTSGIVGQFLNMTGRQQIFRNIVLMAAFIDLLLCYILIPKYGINGAAVATMSSLIFWNVVSVLVVRKADKINTFYFPFLS